MDNLPPKELFTVKEFLALYPLSRSSFYKEVKRKRIIIKKLGARTYIKRVDIQVWLNNLGEEN